MLINLTNQLTQVQGNQITYTAGTISAGGTFSPVKNIGGFNANWAVQIGQTGEETAEIMLVSGVPAGTVLGFGTSPAHSAGTLLYGHSSDAPIYQIHYDQIVFNRSTMGTAGPFSALATVSITPDNQYTQYNDSTGAAGYAYYAQYYNSVTGDLSGSSSVFIPGGPTYYSLQKLRQRAKDKLYSAGYIRDDTLINDWINEWYELMTNSAIKVNQGYLLGTNMYTYDQKYGLGTITDPTFKQPVKLEVTTDGVTFLPSTEIKIYDYSELDYFDAYFPRHVWLGENVFEILPHTEAGSVRMTYSTRFTPLVNDTDELTQTLKAYTTSCVEYCLGVAYGLDQKDSQSQQHMVTYDKTKADFIAEVTPRDVTGAKTISINESVSGLDDSISDEVGDMVW